MESIIKDNVLAHLVDNNLLDKNQHGFLPCHSTTSQLLECHYDWSYVNDVRYPVNVVYIDFSKAFDTMSQCKLVSKLKSFNFFHKTIDWISSFLLNRTQAVKCNRNISCSSHVTSGVPQVSVIGPLLYTLFGNDSPFVCYPCLIKMYADDIKTYYIIRHESDRSVRQLCLNRICD